MFIQKDIKKMFKKNVHKKNTFTKENVFKKIKYHHQSILKNLVGIKWPIEVDIPLNKTNKTKVFNCSSLKEHKIHCFYLSFLAKPTGFFSTYTL